MPTLTAKQAEQRIAELEAEVRRLGPCPPEPENAKYAREQAADDDPICGEPLDTSSWVFPFCQRPKGHRGACQVQDDEF